MLDSRRYSLRDSNFFKKKLSAERRKVHPAREYFNKLHLLEPSENLTRFLSNFNVSRTIDDETFAEGVKQFIQLANSNPISKTDSQLESDRKVLYGNVYLGLHYRNDLAKLWNTDTNNTPIKFCQVSTLSHNGWDSILQDGFMTLIYRGQQPAQALDQLVKGPTVIDCGMFSQLSLWFGIRYMLGNERFNLYFNRSPLFITQLVYNDISDSDKPYLGNPLHSFLSTKEHMATSSVIVKHIANTPLYLLKHPGGNYSGENCVLIDNQYYIFDPHLDNTQRLNESAVLSLLRQAYNEEPLPCDVEQVSLYTENPETVHPKFFKTYGELIKIAADLKDETITKDEFLKIEKNDSPELIFDIQKFTKWLEIVENASQHDQSEYLPQPINYSLISTELLSVIPFENRMSMDFSKFKQETFQQKELITISKHFCQSVMLNRSQLVILTGKAGVGKTAAAVCAAKELTTNGRNVVWISEIMVHSWADQAMSIAELYNCEIEIDKLLASNPDAIFLDDNNLTGFSGNLLLEKIYSWYVRFPGKGLFITSNMPICFNECYGYKLDGQYYYPPFNDYYSPQYINRQTKINLGGCSLRSKRNGQSIGAIVSNVTWEENKNNLKDIELIPAFDKKELLPIKKALRRNGSMGDAYDKLSRIQQQWLTVHEAGGYYRILTDGSAQYVEPYLRANPSKFKKTNCKTIALEIRDHHFMLLERKINYYSIDQLIRILNYAHDQGGRRIIFINQTIYNNKELLDQIKTQLSSSENERTWSRLMLLLCESEDAIFHYDQFNGRIEKNELQVINKRLIEPKLNMPILFGDVSNSFFNKINEKLLTSFSKPEKIRFIGISRAKIKEIEDSKQKAKEKLRNSYTK